MDLFGRSRKEPDRVPTSADFLPENVEKAVLKETASHPVTMMPLGVCVVGLLWCALIGPDATAVGITAASGVAALSSWVTNFFIRGEIIAGRHVAELRRLWERSRIAEHESLMQSFTGSEFVEVSDAAKELDKAYVNIRDFLRERTDAGELSSQRFLILANETYEQGLRILQKVLHLTEALRHIDAGKLERETRGWIRNLDALRKEGREESDADVASLAAKIDSNEKRLQKYRERGEEVKRMLAQCEQLEGELETAYLELIDLAGQQGSISAESSPSRRLETAVKAARLVYDRLSGIGTESSDDEMYHEAGRRLQQEKE